jgi:hypothetical protein
MSTVSNRTVRTDPIVAAVAVLTYNSSTVKQ